MSLDALSLHFVRPEWLWLLLALPLAWLWMRRRNARVDVWKGRIDPHLRPHVLEGGGRGDHRETRWPWLLALALAVLALAGPAWRQQPQPLWQNGRALVVALDLSSATNARDLPPSRLLQARAKLRQLLEARPDGLVGLVAYADDAHAVTPLTEDGANVALFIDSLAPEIMPVDGQDPARAIAFSTQLMQQGGATRGDIVLITDHADGDATAAARKVMAAGFRVSAIGLGSAQGGEVRGRDGDVQRVKLDAASLRAMATAGGGRYAELSADDSDLRALGLLDAGDGDAGAVRGKRGLAWQDEGYWLLLPLMLLSLWAFRRHGAVAVLAFVLTGGVMSPHPAFAQDAGGAGGWWLRADQQQHRAMEAGDRAYRAGKFDEAAQAYARVPGAEAQYNRGNALAKAGRYDEAIAAYDRALAANPKLPDARENRAAVEKAQARQRQQKPGQDDRQGQGKDGKQPPKPGQQQQQQQQPKPGQPQSRDAQGNPRNGQPQPSPSKPGNAAAQRAAEQAQRERMQRELAAQARAGQKPASQAKGKATVAIESAAEREKREAVDAWLRRVPDTPGDWLRQKFWIEHQRRRMGEDR